MSEGNDPDADGVFSNAPIFNFNDGKVKFNANWVDNANENYGSASGFVSKYLPTEGASITDAPSVTLFSLSESILQAFFLSHR